MPTFVDLSAPIEPSPPELPDLLRTPLRVVGASAAPARVVAILDD